jgi:roadblock/LC7 domain-containing protein
MADLSQLMGLEGAIAAFSMNDRGELLEHEIAAGSELNAQALDLLSHMCVANIAIATMQARGWEASSEHKGFYPVQGFTLVGFDWSAVTDGRLGVVLSNQQADYQAAFDLLGRQGGGA